MQTESEIFAVCGHFSSLFLQQTKLLPRFLFRFTTPFVPHLLLTSLFCFSFVRCDCRIYGLSLVQSSIIYGFAEASLPRACAKGSVLIGEFAKALRITSCDSVSQRRLEEINHALRECGVKNAIILMCVFWNICSVVWRDLLAFFCVLYFPLKDSEECTEACSCRLQQLNLSGSLFIRSRQGLASRKYLGGGRRWTRRQTSLSCCTTSYSKLHIKLS